MFERTTVTVKPLPGNGSIEVLIEGGEPGAYDVQVITTDGRRVMQAHAYRSLGNEDPMEKFIDMSAVAHGLYHVVVRTPSGVSVSRVAWLP